MCVCVCGGGGGGGGVNSQTLISDFATQNEFD